MTTPQDILKLLDDIDNDDENVIILQKAMEFFCSNWDICEGYKHALRVCIEDQYSNHEDEQDPADLDKLSDILNGSVCHNCGGELLQTPLKDYHCLDCGIYTQDNTKIN